MSTSLSTLIRLRAIQNKIRKLFENLNDIQYRLQFHPDLSPAGWLLGRGLFMENYWLHEVIQGNTQFTSDKSLFFSDKGKKAQRGPRLPALQHLLNEMSQQQDANDLLLLEKTPPLSEHPLFKDEYIENLIIQHYAHCYENILWGFSQMALKNDRREYQPDSPLKAQGLLNNLSEIQQGQYSVGGEWPFSCDIEMPAQQISLKHYSIAKTPVSNAEYLHFIEDNAYNREEFWTEDAWQWRQKNNIQQPCYWQQNRAGEWYGINHQGAHDLMATDSIAGISHYEACAFTRWAHARLPHEHEWETAARLKLIQKTTDVREWCSNTLYPYEGFEQFSEKMPANSYFDSAHYVLKGAGLYTRPEIRRASFRYFHKPHQRYIFAGLRLVFD